MQAHAERLSAALAGATLEGVAVLSFAALKTVAPPIDAVVGRRLDRMDRRGKLLVLRFGDSSHVVHLMQGGRLKDDPKQAAKPRNGQARWRFADGRALLLTEAGTERKAGVWVVTGDPDDHEPLVDGGSDGGDQGRCIACTQLGGHGEGRQLRPVQHLVGQPAPEPGDAALVAQETVHEGVLGVQQL